ncbi:MAG TPA: TetR-like C-terminal domain-containing protein, partial [Thermomicrobiaceae bacterium]|nr:TetR-like C-terminal domain-containing protein [Thermomicrobiaceae bacterium]
TIYRRFPSKEDLVGSALNKLATMHHGPEEIPHTGSLYQDISNVMDAKRLQVNQAIWPMFCRIIGEAMSTPEFLEVYRKQMIEPRMAILEQKIRGAQERGEIEPEVSPKLILDLVTGFVLSRILLTQNQRNQGLDVPVATPEEARQILDILFFGIATPSERERCQEQRKTEVHD